MPPTHWLTTSSIKELHTEANLIDAYDAAVIERDHKGKVKIVKKHETPTRVGGVLGGGVGLATGLVIVLFPAAAIGGGLLLGTTGAGASSARWPGTQRPGMSRGDLKELGESLDEGEAGLVVVAVSDMESQGPLGHEAGAQDRGEAAQGGPEGDRSRRRRGAEVLGPPTTPNGLALGS